MSEDHDDGAFTEERREHLRRTRDRELEAMAREALEKARKTAAAQNTHEAVCAERYKGINDKLTDTRQQLGNLVKIGTGILLAVCGTAVMLIVNLVMSGAAG